MSDAIEILRSSKRPGDPWRDAILELDERLRKIEDQLRPRVEASNPYSVMDPQWIESEKQIAEETTDG